MKKLERLVPLLNTLKSASQPTLQIIPPLIGQYKWSSDTFTDMVIMDSSFNPPTLAHQSLALKAVLKVINSCPIKHPKVALWLILSTSNPDKPGNTGASWEERAYMMQLLQSDINRNLLKLKSDIEVEAKIGIINRGKFVEKAEVLWNWWTKDKSEKTTLGKLYFVMGIDTLVRVLDPKYYIEKQNSVKDFEVMVNILNKFFITHKSCILVSERDGYTSENSQYLLDTLLSRYRSNIINLDMTSGKDLDSNLNSFNEDIGSISSTRVRKLMKELHLAQSNKQIKSTEEIFHKLTPMISPNILQAVQEFNLYK